MAQTLDKHFNQIHIGEALNHVVKHMVPPKALQRAKRYLRRECRKPSDMPIRSYYQHLTRMNMEELPFLPPFGTNQFLSTDEMLDILLYGTPKSWQREMDRQGYDPLTHNPTEVVDFMERIEQSEEYEPKKNQASTSNGKTAKTKSSSYHNKAKTSSETLFCLLHGNCSHTTNDCHALKEQAKRLKTSNGDKSKNKYGNKTWTKKADDSSKQSQKELNALVKKHLKKELNALSEKKRKSKSEDDLNMEIAAIDLQLQDFSYEDMENMEIKSNDDKSVGEISC